MVNCTACGKKIKKREHVYQLFLGRIKENFEKDREIGFFHKNCISYVKKITDRDAQKIVEKYFIHLKKKGKFEANELQIHLKFHLPFDQISRIMEKLEKQGAREIKEPDEEDIAS